MLNWLHILGLAALVLLGGWLSGHDARLVGDGRRSDFWRRFIRVMVTLFLVESMAIVPIAAPGLLVIVGVIWAGCVSELVSGLFRRFLDPASHDKREFDLHGTQRQLDELGHLVRTGKRAEAIQLCETLKTSGTVSLSTLEDTLAFLGVEQTRAAAVDPLTEAARWRAAGKPEAAEPLLLALLAKNPRHAAATMLLMRIYAQDWHQPGRAAKILQQFERQPHVEADHVEFARRSLTEWSQPQPQPVISPLTTPAPPESLEQLLADGLFGSAIELLEEQIAASPANFNLRLKLAEVHARFCGNIPRAEKILRQIDADPAFTPQQIQLAWTRFREWREPKNSP